MELLFYIIERQDGKMIDLKNETPYIVCNDAEDANDLVVKLPNAIGGYNVTVCEVDRDLIATDVLFTTDN